MRPSITKDPRATRGISPGCQAGVPTKLRFALGIIYRAKSWTMCSVADAKWSATGNSSVASCYQPSSCLVDDNFYLGSVSSAVKCRGKGWCPRRDVKPGRLHRGVSRTSLGQFRDRSLRQGRAWRFVAGATWNLGELLAYLLPRNIELVQLLQVHPKIGAHSKILAEPQGCIAGDPAAASQNACNSGGRHLDGAREFTGAHPQRPQFVRKLLAGVNRGSGHPRRRYLLRRTSRLGLAPVCSPRSKTGVPATRVAS